MPAKWELTAEDLLAGRDLSGVRALVTGVSAGIGLETARVLVAKGATVIGAVRNIEKAQRAARSVGLSTGDRFSLIDLDLASLASVRACADRITAEMDQLDLIIANAGMMAGELVLTADGFESQLAGNYLGHFVLINRLAPLIPPGGRVVILSSIAHRFGDIDLDDMNFTTRPYDVGAAYSAAKTAATLFMVELDRRLGRRGIRAAAVHPGAVGTDLAGSLSPELVEQMMAKMLSQGVQQQSTVIKSIPQGTATTVWAGLIAPADEVGGRYCEDCVVLPASATAGNGPQPYAVDPERAARLWRLTEQMVGEKFD